MTRFFTTPGETDISIGDALALTTGVDYWTTPEDRMHNIRSMRFADGPHGLRVQDDVNPDHLGLERSAPATCFPPAVTLASSWDEELIEEIGEALGREARASGVDVVLGPGLNIKRSPLCGRNFEYYSEDPLLAGKLAGAMARGIQNEGVAACLKHFAVNNQETDRMRVSANVDERTLREIYLRAFQIALEESRAWTIMTSYNRINGVYASENRWLLRTVLRDEWKFDGLVISDWGAVTDPVASVNAGLDMRMPGRPKDPRVRAAYEDGKIETDAVVETLKRLHLLAARTGGERASALVDHAAHNALTRRAAAESTVLLSNDGVLPLALRPGLKIAIIGEMARSPRIQGAGSSRVNARETVSGLEALTARATAAGASVEFAPGYSLSINATADDGLIAGAVELAHRSDVVVLFIGLPGEYEAEGGDRTHIELPADQLALIDGLRSTCPAIVAAMSNGAVVSTASWRGAVNAIVEFWLTGQAHGATVADVLFGDVDPGGRLAETVPLRIEDQPAYLNFPGEHQNVNYGEGIFVGYRAYDARRIAVDYPFGHGLSYTRFDYSDLKITVRPLEDEIAFEATLTVSNSGARAGSDVVQLYTDYRSDATFTPPLELRGWKKVRLDAGQSATVTIAVARKHLTHWNTGTNSWVFPGGALTVHIGASSRDLRLQQKVTVPGHPVPVLLTAWSSLGEWLDHPVMGNRLTNLLSARGGIKGRLADLLADDVGRYSVRANPLVSVAEFPGVPLDPADVDALCAELQDLQSVL